MSLKRLSPKQQLVMQWWCSERTKGYDGIICDGAIRSGKTMSMSLSFVIWAMSEFDRRAFGICGKTLISLRRNLVVPLTERLEGFGFRLRENLSKNYIDAEFAGKRNRFYLFGGKDEASASHIQGVTLAGVLLDETALMPRSFLEQAVARCSVRGSRLWFNCNPDNPYHWFKREWIDKAVQKKLLYIHFDLKDNPSLSDEVISRYKRLYTGAFYDRFILGRWAAAEGLVYAMFDEKKCVVGEKELGELAFGRYAVSCDYGTVNPASFGLWGKAGDTWYRIDEYYYDSAREGMRRTDEEHYEGLRALIGEREVSFVVCDPSAASFIQCMIRHGDYPVRQAKNDVVSGIRRVSDYLRGGKIKIGEKCEDSIREFSLYRWDEGSGKDCPIKENDHAMDDIRYFVTAIEEGEAQQGGTAFSIARSKR
ncbi:MAG: PBSX family phage terminase large subunit [Ruminococcus sp.]|nr:PBSX family phage terminase large subunit [Ruminococcus sp.]